MTNASRALWWTTRSGALAGFGLGGLLAVVDVAGARHVREFQAGASAPITERVVAVLQRAALEGLGFGLLAFLLGLVAVVASGLAPGAQATVTTRGQRFAAWFVLAAAAFVLWSGFGTWLGNEALPFLDPGPLALLDLAGFLACLVGFGVGYLVLRLLPFAPRTEPAAVALGAAIGLGLSLDQALDFLRASPDSRAFTSLAQAAGITAVGLPLGVLIALAARPVARALGARLADRGFLPRGLRRGLFLGLGVAVVVSAFTFQLSAASADASYEELSPRGAPAGPNVVLVTVDTLRADHLGCYGYDRPTSPLLDSVAAGGALFADASSAAAWTKPATGTILTGLYPSRHGALYHGSSLQLPAGEQTLAEAFQDGGYVTAGFVTNPNVKRIFAFDRGFDEFFDSPVEDTVSLAAIRGSHFGQLLMKLTRHQFNWKYENDVFQMNRHILAWLRANREQRFFLYLHYIDPHIPYTPPPPYKEEFARDHGLVTFNERKEKVGVDLYDGEIRYTDEGLRQLVDELRALDLWDDTLFVLTSDHGEEFFEHEVMGHGFSLYQGVIHVPLLFHGPGVPPGTVVEEPVQIVDMAATILDLAGVAPAEVGGGDELSDALSDELRGERRRRQGDGRSFADALRDPGWRDEEPYYLENEFGTDDRHNRSFVLSGVRQGPFKLVLTERNQYRPVSRYGGVEFYDLATDPDERHNLIHDDVHRELIKSLTERLNQHSRFLVETGFRDIAPANLSPEMQAELEALGYAGD